jgi:hypothetical protein
MRTLALTAVALAIPGLCALEEGRLRDLRLRGGLSPGSAPIDAAYSGAGYAFAETADGFDPGLRGSIAVFESIGPTRSGTALFGLSLGISRHRVDLDRGADDEGLEANTVALDLHVGYAVSLTERVHVEATAFGGGGGVRITDRRPLGAAGDQAGDQGPYLEGGLSCGGFATYANGFQVGLSGGLLIYRGSATVTWEETGDRAEYEYIGAGPFLELSVGLRF